MPFKLINKQTGQVTDLETPRDIRVALDLHKDHFHEIRVKGMISLTIFTIYDVTSSHWENNKDEILMGAELLRIQQTQ